MMNKIQYLTSIIVYSLLMIGTITISNSLVYATTDQSSSDQSSSDQSSSDQTSSEQPSLETVDSNLENCIQELENDSTDEALGHCQNADDELDRLIANATG